MQRSKYSASVILTLIVSGIPLVLSHVGPDFLIVRESSQRFEKCQAELLVSVDGISTQKLINLPNGISEGKFAEVVYSVLF